MYWDSWSSLGARSWRQRRGREVIANSARNSASLVLGSPSTNQPERALEWPWDRPRAGSEAVSQCQQGQWHSLVAQGTAEGSTGEKTEMLILIGKLQLYLKAES